MGRSKSQLPFFFDHDIKIFQINRCITKPKTNQIIFFLLRKVIFLLKFGRKIIHYKNLIFQVSAIIYKFVAIHYLLTHQKLVSITENMLNRGFQFHAKGLLKWYIWFDTISPSWVIQYLSFKNDEKSFEFECNGIFFQNHVLIQFDKIKF